MGQMPNGETKLDFLIKQSNKNKVGAPLR